MAIVRYVNTASSAGGDGTTNNTAGATRAFATLLEALNSLGASLSDQTTIYCEGTAADTSNVDQTPWDFTTTATNYLRIVGNNTSGKWNTSAYRLEAANRNGIYNNEAAHLRLENLQVHITAGADGIAIKTANNNVTETDADYRVSGCIMRGSGAAGQIGSVVSAFGGAGAGTVKHWNCIAYDFANYGYISDLATAEYYNCTAHSNEYGFLCNVANGMKCVNCLSTANGSADFLDGGAFASGTSYNASGDTSAPGTNSRISQTFTFKNAAGDDFRLAYSDGGAKDFGTSDPASGLYSTDIEGATRSGSWDIGADEAAPPTAAVTGTATASITESDIVAGGKTVILTLTDDTYVPATGTPTFNVGTTKGTTAADSAGGGGGRTGNGDLTCTFPSGYTPTAGHFALMILYNDQGDGSTPTDWTEITGSPWGAGTEKLLAFYKVLVGGESDPVTTISGSTTNASHCATMVIYTGVGSIGAIGTASNGTGTPMTAGAITTTANNVIVCGLCGRGDNENASGQTLNASSTGVAERLDGGTAAGNDSQCSMYDKTFPTSGTSSGNGSATTSVTDPWVSVLIELLPSAPFADARAAIRNGLDSAQSEAGGWDAKVKGNIPVANVVRTSDTVCTITLQAQADYDISATETITATIPAAALTGAAQIVATPTFTVDPAGGGNTVNPTKGSLTLTGRVAGVEQPHVVAPVKGALTLTGNTPAVTLGVNINPTKGALVLTGYQPTVTRTEHQAIAPATGSLTLTGQTATVTRTAHQTIAASTGHLTATGYAPGVTRTAHQAVAPPKGELFLTGQQATVSQTAHVVVAPATGSLTLAGYAPTVVQPQTVAPSAGHLALTGYAPTVGQGANTEINPATGHVTLTGYVPTVSRTEHQVVAPTVGQLTLTGRVPTVTQTAHQVIAPSVAHLTLTGNVPTIQQGAGQTFEPGTGHLTLTGSTATVERTAHQIIVPAKGALTLTGKTPTVEQESGNAIVPSVGHLTLTGRVPTLVRTDHQYVNPASGHLALTGRQSAVEQPIVIGPNKGALTLTGQQPTVERTANVVASPATGHLTLTGRTPTIAQTGAVAVTPAVGHLTLTGHTPELVQDGYVIPFTGHLVLTGRIPRAIVQQPVPADFPQGPWRIGSSPAADVLERVGSATAHDVEERIGAAVVTPPMRRIG